VNKLLSSCRVNSPDELCAVLDESRVDVPARGDGRTSDHTEAWTLAHLLSTLNSAGRLCFPLQWCKRERPDYVIASANQDLGIEISELVSPALAQAVAIRNEESPGQAIDPSLFRPGVEPASRDEVRARLRGGMHGYGWSGNSVEREWADAVVDRTSIKSRTLAEAGYSLYAENWLLLYDNLPGPMLRLSEAADLARPRLQPYLTCHPAFSRVWVLSHEQFVGFTDAVELLPIVAPWGRCPTSR
jgi:hypothetical protein